MDDLSESYLLLIASFLEPSIDQISLALCSKRLLQFLSHSVRFLCVRCNISDNEIPFADHKPKLKCSHHIIQDEYSLMGALKNSESCTKAKEQDTFCGFDESVYSPCRQSLLPRPSQLPSNLVEIHFKQSSNHSCLQIDHSSVSVVVKELKKTKDRAIPDSASIFATKADEMKRNGSPRSPKLRKRIKMLAKREEECRLQEVDQMQKILRFLPIFTSLRSLTLCSALCDPTSPELNRLLTGINQACGNSLVHLDLSGCPVFNPEVLFPHKGIFPSLKNLVLDYCTQIRDMHLSNLRACTNLTCLSMVGCSIRGSTLHEISSLTELDVSGCLSIQDCDVASLAILNLKKLNMCGCNQRQFTGSSLDVLQELIWLDLSKCNQLSDACFRSCAKLTKLEHLDLSGIPCVSDSSVVKIVEGTQNSLKWFSLAMCFRVQSITFLSLHSSQLQHLDICGIGYCDEALQSIGSSFSVIKRTLKSLRISKILDTNVLISTLAQMEKLEILGIEHSDTISDVVLASIRSMTRLKALCLYASKGFTWEGVTNLVNSEGLEWLDLRLCPLVSEKLATLPQSKGVQNLWECAFPSSDNQEKNKKTLSILIDAPHCCSSVARVTKSQLDTLYMEILPPLESDTNFSGTPTSRRSPSSFHEIDYNGEEFKFSELDDNAPDDTIDDSLLQNHNYGFQYESAVESAVESAEELDFSVSSSEIVNLAPRALTRSPLSRSFLSLFRRKDLPESHQDHNPT